MYGFRSFLLHSHLIRITRLQNACTDKNSGLSPNLFWTKILSPSRITSIFGNLRDWVRRYYRWNYDVLRCLWWGIIGMHIYGANLYTSLSHRFDDGETSSTNHLRGLRLYGGSEKSNTKLFRTTLSHNIPQWKIFR